MLPLNAACRELYGKNFPVYLCHWHVKRAWLKKLLEKCGIGMPKAIFDYLAHFMAMLKHHNETDAAFLDRVKQSMEQLYTDFAEQKAFVTYFRPQWGTDVKLSKSC